MAYKGDQESDPWTQSFAAVETQNIDWYTRNDTNSSHPSGLALYNDGSVVTLSYANTTNHPTIDFVADYGDSISAIEYADPNINKNNGVAYNATYGYNTMDMAPARGDQSPYTTNEKVVPQGTFALLKDPNGEKDNDDHYAKLYVKGVDGTRWTVDVTVQPIGGLRWLVK